MLRSQLVALVGRLGIVTLAGPLSGGCYAHSRVDSAGVTPGQDVFVEINDQGRVDLAGAIGPQPFRVEGRLTQRTDSTVVLSVRSVETLRGERVTWTGESITLRRNGVTGMQQRRFSRGRTALLIAGAVAAVTAVVLSISLDVFGGGGSDVGDRPGGGNEQ